VQTIDDLIALQTRQSGLAFKKIIALALKLHGLYKQSLFCGALTQALPMPQSGEYPLFTRYPD
jgi:hypothetical protein